MKTTVKYHSAPTTMITILKPDQCWHIWGTIEILIYFCGDHKMVQPVWCIVWQFLIKVNIVTIWSSNPNPKYLPKGSKHICLHNEFTEIYKAVLLILSHNNKQPKYLLTLEWVRKSCYISTRWNTTHLWKGLTTWMNLRDNLLSEKNATHKRIHCTIN